MINYLLRGSVHFFSFMILLLGILLLVLWRKKRRKSYLLSFALFGLYSIFVLRLTLFPIPSINLIRNSNNFFAPYNLNLIPFYFGECRILRYCIMGSIANIYLTIPFGFGIHFLISLNKKNRIWFILLLGISFEMGQLLISLIVGSPYRVIDINDVIFNAFGVIVGIGIFNLFVWVYIKISNKWQFFQKGWFNYFYEVAINDQFLKKKGDAEK